MSMRRILTLTLLLAPATAGSAAMIGEPGSMYDTSVALLFDGAPRSNGWPEVYRDDIESLSLGPVDGQVNHLGQTWFSYDATVESAGENQFISQTNTYADDYLYPEVGTTLPPTDGPFLFGVDGELSDLNTSRFYTPVDNTIGQIFTRVGDSDNDGCWEVLQLDGAGNPYFAETAVPILLSFHLEIVVEGSDLEVIVNGGSIFTGEVIDTTPFGGPGPSSVLTGAYFESGNNAGGENSVATYDNVSIAIPEPAVVLLMLVGAVPGCPGRRQTVRLIQTKVSSQR